MTFLSQIAAHTTREVAVRIADGVVGGAHAVTFEAEALPGTLAAFAGTLAISRLDIVSAVVHKTSDGRVVDTFDVRPLDGLKIGATTPAELASLARAIVTGERNVRLELAALRALFPPSIEFTPVVAADTASELTTGITVQAADRPGLLYDIAATLTAQGLRTRSLSVISCAGKAHDTFRVVDATGRPLVRGPVLELVLTELRRVCA